MGLGNKIKQYPSQLSSTFKRFPLAIGFLLLQTIIDIILLYSIHHNNGSFLEDLFETGFLSTAVTYPTWGALLSIGLKLYKESDGRFLKPITWISHVSILILSIALSYLIGSNGVSEEKMFHIHVTTLLFLTLGVFLLPTLKEKNDFSLWRHLGKTTKKFLIAGLITTAFVITTNVTLAGIGFLFDFNLLESAIWGYSEAVCWVFIAPFLLLAGFHSMDFPKEPPIPGKFISGIMHFLFIPVQLIYIAFLYLYCIKCAVEGHMQCDVFSITITIALSLSVLFTGILRPAQFIPQKKFDQVLLKILSFSTFPLLIVMSAILIRRICHDGMTLTRLYIIAINIFFYTVYAFLFLKKVQKKIWWSMVSFCFIALLISIIPFSLFDNPPVTDCSSTCFSGGRCKASCLEDVEKPEEEIPLQANSSTKLVDSMGSKCKDNHCREQSTRHTMYKAKTSEATDIPADFKQMQFFDEIFFKDDLIKIENDTIFIQLKYGNDNTAEFTIPSEVFITDYLKNPKPLVLKSEKATLLILECYLIFYPYVSEMNRLNVKSAILFTK